MTILSKGSTEKIKKLKKPKIVVMKRLSTIILLLFLSQSIFSQIQCGKERWDVKTLSDPDTTKINFNQLVQTTVHEQVSLAAPGLGKDVPRSENETTVYQIKCRILGFKSESGVKGDKDIHIVLEDPDTHETMIAEIPNAQCESILKTSREQQFVDLDQWFIDNIGNPTGKYYQMPNAVTVVLTGVGFFDFNHGQTGVAKNAREIHPVLSMELADANYITTTGNFVRPAVINSSPNLNNMNTPTTPLNFLIIILLGAILGAVGQGIRVIVGVKKVNDNAVKTNTAVNDTIDYRQMAFSLIIAFAIGGIAGVLAAVSSDSIQFTKSTVIAFITAGYAGTDFIEGFIKKYPNIKDQKPVNG